jgi:hypothetical protein
MNSKKIHARTMSPYFLFAGVSSDFIAAAAAAI